uniref:Calcineurin binding protein cabin 1 n=1 Tax=Echinococcus granulosus TaxID=6210 RepID=A0A068WCT1_ECHGR|nr:calcineurin binding protein cabin 1 [Echinococcus granulosus]
MLVKGIICLHAYYAVLCIPLFRFRPITYEGDASDSSFFDDRTNLSELSRNVDLDHANSPTVGDAVTTTGLLDNPQGVFSTTDAIRRLLRPVREKHSSKEAEEVRITQLYQHALQISSDSESSLEAIPLLESIVHSFLLRSAPSIPSHLKTIKFASCKHLANLYLKSENLETALKWFKLAVDLDATDLSVWLKLASTAITLHRFDVATPALTHILKEQPSHPLALHWALPYFFAISEFEACISYSVRCLFIDPRNQAAIHCIRRVLALRPSLDFLLEKLLERHPNVLSHAIVSEEAKVSTDERIAKIREGYMRMLDEFKNADAIKTVKFPEPLTKLSWEHLAHAFVNMFDRLNKEGTINSMLDLRSLFEGCQIPSRQHSQDTEVVASMDVVIIDVDSEVSFQPLSSDTCGDSSQQASQVHPESTEAQQTSTGVKGDEDDHRRISKRIRRSTVMFDDIPQGSHGLSGVITTTPSSYNLHVVTPGTGAAMVAASTPCAGPHGPSTTAADAQLTRWLWIEKATRFRSLLPSCFRDLALLTEKTHALSIQGDVESDKLTLERHLAKGSEDEGATPSDVVLESDLVTEFLRTLADDKPNAVLLGVALLLQMSAHIKPWTQSFSTAYLAVSARIRPCLPLWQPSTLPKEPNPPTEELILPIDLLRLRQCPSLWHLTNLHTAYAEVRLDALVLCHKATDSAKRRSTSSSAFSRRAGAVDFEDLEFKALSQALQVDSARFLEPDETISIPDFNKVIELVSLLPEDAPETLVFHGRILWINYELSVATHKYDAMKDYLLQMKEFVTEHGSLRRSCSFRNSYVTLDRIDELLAEVKDASIGERLQHLCKAEQDTAKLLKALKDCLHSHSAALCKGKCTQLHPGIHLEGIPRICRMLYQPLITLDRRLSGLHGDSEAARETVLLALRCWRVAMQTLALVAARCVKGERLSSLPTLPLPEEEAAGLEDVWRTVTVAYALLQTCWDIIDSEMSSDPNAKAFAKRLTPESLCSKAIFTFKQCDGKLLILTFGQFCQTLRLIIDTFAWRLLATGALGLPVPELSYKFIVFVYEILDRIESCFPIHLLHPKLAIYRALYDLGRPDVDQRAVRSILAFLRGYPSSRMLRCARGRDTAPPSLLLLHLLHDLLPFTTTHCCFSSAPMGLRYLRCVAVTVARALQCLSEGYHRLQASENTDADDEDFVDTPHQSIEKMEVEAKMTNSSHRLWPFGGARVGEALAQAIHCLCGLPARPCASTSTTTTTTTTTSDPSKVSSLASSSSSPNSSRFKQAATPPEPAYKSYERRVEAVIEVPTFTALPSATVPMPPSCVAPRPPIWLADRTLFYESVKEHVIDLSCPSTNVGVWWSGARPSALDWQLIELAFIFYRPAIVPEYDSIKSLSISSELANWLTEAVKLMPKTYEEFMIPEGQIDSCMTMHAPLPEQIHYLSDMLNLMYYLLADYYTKNNNFDLAIRYYKQDLRVAPHHADSWAALALIYSSHLEQILNVIDPKTERVTSRAVASCLRCFDLALQLQPRLTTLLTERGCLAYQLHSYAARLIKKSINRPFQETHLRLCMQWRRRMLTLAYRSYGQALRLERRRSSSPEVTQKEVQPSSVAAGEAAVVEPSPLSISSASPSAVGGSGVKVSPVTSTPVDEEWLYHYMLTKCEEKAGPGALFREENLKKHQLHETRSEWVLRVLNNYQRTANILRAAGAKYPKKIIVYNKLPHLAVESIEVFYRTHAFILKVLLAAGEPEPSSPSPLPLRQICEALYSLTQSAFVTEPAKASGKIRSRKRPSLMPEPPAKVTRLEGVIGGCSVSGGALDTSVEAPTSSPPQSDAEVTVEVVSRPSFASISDLDLWKKCVEYCREALELVLRRLPLHYKSMYRLAHLYLNQPSMQDLDKAMAILMGPFDHVTKVEYGGLFKDRRQSNFFHGVWRIPTADIDRSGSFASHMYRSTLMVLEVLNKRGDWTRMLQVFHQLRKQPPEDKRGFLSEGDRVFLARRAFSLIHPTLRLWLLRQQERVQQQETSGGWSEVSVETLQQIYRLHSFAQSRAAAAAAAAAAASASQTPPPSSQPHSSVECVEAEEERTEEARSTDVAPCFAELLAQAYELCPAAWDSAGPNLSKDLILKRCLELTSTPSASTSSQMKSASTSRLTDAAAAQTIL